MNSARMSFLATPVVCSDSVAKLEKFLWQIFFSVNLIEVAVRSRSLLTKHHHHPWTKKTPFENCLDSCGRTSRWLVFLWSCLLLVCIMFNGWLASSAECHLSLTGWSSQFWLEIKQIITLLTADDGEQSGGMRCRKNTFSLSDEKLPGYTSSQSDQLLYYEQPADTALDN